MWPGSKPNAWSSCREASVIVILWSRLSGLKYVSFKVSCGSYESQWLALHIFTRLWQGDIIIPGDGWKIKKQGLIMIGDMHQYRMMLHIMSNTAVDDFGSVYVHCKVQVQGIRVKHFMDWYSLFDHGHWSGPPSFIWTPDLVLFP